MTAPPPPPARRGAARRGRAGLALVAASLALVAVTSALGDSAASRAVGRQGPLPPYAGAVHPSPWLVVTLLTAATLAGLAGSLAAWSALSRGWAPDPRRLLAGGLVAAFALLLVPPATSDDLYSYTAYGRMAVVGRDPYTTTPNDLPDDPVARDAGDPWRDAPSVYGPLATAEQWVAMRVAGPDTRTGAALLALLSAAAFAGTGLLLHAAAPDDAGRRRAALLWTLNPLLLTHLVAGAHVDALLVLPAVAAVLLLRRHPFAAGALAGAAAAVKVSGVLAAAALAWTERRRPRRLALVAAGAVSVTPPLYLLGGGQRAFGPVRRASRFVSFGSPWRALSVPLDHFAGSSTSRAIVSALSLVAVALLALLLARGLPRPAAGAPTSFAADPPRPGRAWDDPARAAAVVTLAWLLGATYVLPWYDAWAWPFLALLPASRWDRWLALRTAVLTLAYLPGRIVPFPSPLAGLLSGMRLYVTPVALGLLLAVAVRWCLASARAPAGTRPGVPDGALANAPEPA